MFKKGVYQLFTCHLPIQRSHFRGLSLLITFLFFVGPSEPSYSLGIRCELAIKAIAFFKSKFNKNKNENVEIPEEALSYRGPFPPPRVLNADGRIEVGIDTNTKELVLPNGKRYPVQRWLKNGSFMIQVPYGDILKGQSRKFFKPSTWEWLTQPGVAEDVNREFEKTGVFGVLLEDGRVFSGVDSHHRMLAVAMLRRPKEGVRPGSFDRINEALIPIRISPKPDQKYYALTSDSLKGEDAMGTAHWVQTINHRRLLQEEARGETGIRHTELWTLSDEVYYKNWKDYETISFNRHMKREPENAQELNRFLESRDEWSQMILIGETTAPFQPFYSTP